MQKDAIIRRAEFSPKIKTYVLFYVGLLLLVTIIGIPLLIIWLLGFGQWVGKKYYEHLECTLSERHLVFSKGAFFKVEKTIPLENIQDLTFLQNPILNLLELKILKIETAGGSNPSGSDMKLIGILDLEGFKEEVIQQRERIRAVSRGNQPSLAEEQLTVLKEIRDLLRNQKD